MKIRKTINILFFFFIFVNSNLNAESIFFDSKNIKIQSDGNMVFANKGVANIPSENLKIQGDKFIYDRVGSELTIFDKSVLVSCA